MSLKTDICKPCIFAFSISNNTHGLLCSHFMSRHETLPHTLKFVGRSVAWRNKEQLRRRLVRHQKVYQQRIPFYINIFNYLCLNVEIYGSVSVVTRIRTIKLCCPEMITKQRWRQRRRQRRRRRRRQRERRKSNRFRLAKQQACMWITLFSTFFFFFLPSIVARRRVFPSLLGQC